MTLSCYVILLCIVQILAGPILSFPNFTNNSISATEFHVVVHLDLAAIEYNYQIMSMNPHVCVDNGFEVVCSAINQLSTTYTFNWSVEDNPKDTVPLQTLHFLFFSFGMDGNYRVNEIDGFNLEEEAFLVTNIMTREFASRYAPIIAVTLQNDNIVGSQTFALLILGDVSDSLKLIVDGSISILLSEGASAIHLISSSESSCSLEFNVARHTCCVLDPSRPGIPANCLPPGVDVGIIIIGKDAGNGCVADLVSSIRGHLYLFSDQIMLSPGDFFEDEICGKLNIQYFDSGDVKTLMKGNLRPSSSSSECCVESRHLAFPCQQVIPLDAAGSPSWPRADSQSHFSFKLGVNVAHLHDVFLLEDLLSVLLLHHTNHSHLNSNFLSFKFILQNSYSGFFRGHNNLPAGNSFVECSPVSEKPQLSCQSDGIYSGTIDLLQQASPFPSAVSHWLMSGASAMLTPPYSPSIFHSAQVLMSLFYAADSHLLLCRSLEQKLAADSLKRFEWVARLRRVILPSTQKNDLDWTLTLVNIIIKYVETSRNQCNSIKQSANYSVDSAETSKIKVYLKDDLVQLFESATNNDSQRFHENDNDLSEKSDSDASVVVSYPEKLLKFDELIVLGALELRVPFFSSSDSCSRFRTFVYDELNITQGDQPQSAEESPNSPLNVVLLLRSKNRWILNVKAIEQLILRSGLIGPFASARQSPFLRVVLLENLSMKDQVSLFRGADIVISPHGAGLQNLMFMLPHSAVIEVITSPWYEPGYQATALVCDLHYSTVVQSNLANVGDCSFSADCMETDLIVERRHLGCFGMRQCNCYVDLSALEVSLWQASQSVRLMKRRIQRFREPAVDGSKWWHAEAGEATFYKKAFNDGLII